MLTAGCPTCSAPGLCDDGCLGWFRNDETGRIERCDTCARFDDDAAALAHVLACHLPEGGCDDCGVAHDELHAEDCPRVAGQVYVDGVLEPAEAAEEGA